MSPVHWAGTCWLVTERNVSQKTNRVTRTLTFYLCLCRHYYHHVTFRDDPFIFPTLPSSALAQKKASKRNEFCDNQKLIKLLFFFQWGSELLIKLSRKCRFIDEHVKNTLYCVTVLSMKTVS